MQVYVVCLHECRSGCVCVCLHVPVAMCAYAYVCDDAVYVCACVCICVYVCMYVCVHAHVRTLRLSARESWTRGQSKLR